MLYIGRVLVLEEVPYEVINDDGGDFITIRLLKN